jgi:hypothetical protein
MEYISRDEGKEIENALATKGEGKGTLKVRMIRTGLGVEAGEKAPRGYYID